MTDAILLGDVRSCLKQLEDSSVQCCVTSPPYWGLRDYGCEGQIGLEPTPEAIEFEEIAETSAGKGRSFAPDAQR